MSLLDKHLLLLTSTNLACNPRCLKEVKLLRSKGAKVSVVAFHLHNWSDEIEKKLNSELSDVCFNYLETTKKELLPWLISSAFEKISRLLLVFFPSSLFLSAMAVSKRSWLILQWTKKNKTTADFVIAHNPAAFYPAYRLAKKSNIPFALDIEDYHPGEHSPLLVKQAVSFLMTQLMPKTAYTSFASPMIKLYSEKLLTGKSNSSIVINNVFSKEEFIAPVTHITETEKIKLVWFSQYIDYNRGLEKVLPVLDMFSDSVFLTLIGNTRDNFFLKELKERKYVHCIASIPQAELNRELSKYDIGLAIEDGTADLNRDICLTNKIWSYFQAGLFIIASDTAAQKLFLAEHPLHGTCTSLINEKLRFTFQQVVENREAIQVAKKNRFETARPFNWENESAPLLNAWKQMAGE